MKPKALVRSLIVLLVLTLILLLCFYLRATPAHSGVSMGDLDTDETPNLSTDTAAVLSALAPVRPHYQISSSTPQFVVLSFDGSKSVDMLKETLDFEQHMQSENKPLHFTYFINAAYFLTQENANLYQAPQGPAGTTMIGFSNTAQDIPARVKMFNSAFLSGNEIGSHTAGHFDGTHWSYDQWKQEFESFNSLFINVSKNNPTQSIDNPLWLSSIEGFRAPNLGVNDNMYRVLRDYHFAFDSSGVGGIDTWPTKDQYGIWHIPLGTIFLGPNKNPIIAMDYNLWMRQSGAQEVAVKNTPQWYGFYNDVLTAYTNYFNLNYHGNRAPIVIGDHFSKWNDGVYWEAMKALAENVCGQPQVQCVTFKTVVDYLNTTGAPPIISQ